MVSPAAASAGASTPWSRSCSLRILGHMGVEIRRDRFDDADFAKFEVRMRHCLTALANVLARPGFGRGAPSIGAELELDLVDAGGRPAPINRRVLAETLDP